MTVSKLGTLLLVLLMALAIPHSAAADANSSDSNTNSNSEDDMFSLTVVLVAAAASVYMVGSYTAYKLFEGTTGNKKENEQAAKALGRYLQKNHSSVTRDIVSAQGLFWDTWSREGNITEQELSRIQAQFSGSAEQTAMLNALNSDLSANQARRFAQEMMRTARTTLGEKRFSEVVAYGSSRYTAATENI